MENKKSHYFYVLLCQDGSFYGGYTTEPERRLTEHNSGTGAKYTRLALSLIHISEPTRQ